MKLLTLTTDYGLSDYYLPLFKAKILSHAPNVQFVDISHNTKPHYLQTAAFNVKNVWREFPENTLHVIRVGEGLTNEYLACRVNDHFFLLPNNGLISLLFDEEETKSVILIQANEANLSRADFLCPIIKHILNQLEIDVLGEELTDYVQLFSQRPTVSPTTIRGSIQHIDQYGNLFTNISRELFEKQAKNRKYKVQARGFRPQQIRNQFADVDPGELVVRFNSEQILLIGINQGNANELLGLKVNDVVQVTFLD